MARGGAVGGGIGYWPRPASAPALLHAIDMYNTFIVNFKT